MTLSSMQLVGAVVISAAQRRKRRHREAKRLAQGHTARRAGRAGIRDRQPGFEVCALSPCSALQHQTAVSHLSWAEAAP